MLARLAPILGCLWVETLRASHFFTSGPPFPAPVNFASPFPWMKACSVHLTLLVFCPLSQRIICCVLSAPFRRLNFFTFALPCLLFPLLLSVIFWDCNFFGWIFPGVWRVLVESFSPAHYLFIEWHAFPPALSLAAGP